jgi:hypothetical protein
MELSLMTKGHSKIVRNGMEKLSRKQHRVRQNKSQLEKLEAIEAIETELYEFEATEKN